MTSGSGQAVSSSPYVVPTDPSDFDVVFAAHFRRLVVALRLSGAGLQTAEDIAQDAFLIAYGRWPRIRTGSNPAGYVYRVAFRLLKKSPCRELPREMANQPAPDEVGAVETAVVVRDALNGMPARRKHVAVLCLQAGFSIQETSRVLRMKRSTVRVHLHHARKTLTRILQLPE